MKTGGDPVTCTADIRPVGYLISRTPGVLFVRCRGVPRGGRNDGRGIDLSGKSRPISLRPRDIDDCVDLPRARRGTGLRGRRDTRATFAFATLSRPPRIMRPTWLEIVPAFVNLRPSSPSRKLYRTMNASYSSGRSSRASRRINFVPYTFSFKVVHNACFLNSFSNCTRPKNIEKYRKYATFFEKKYKKMQAVITCFFSLKKP